MWNNLDSTHTTEEYLLATYDPLTPMRFIDPTASGTKGTKDINSLPEEKRREFRNMAKIAVPGSESKPVKRNATIENMFTRQVEKKMIID